MNKEVKEKWLNALKSGDYPKAVGRLRTNDGYCCLGVLCDLYRKENKGAHWVYQGDTVYNFFISRLGSNILEPSIGTTHLPEEVVEWSELKGINPYVENQSLATINDCVDTFELVIEAIEDYL